MHALRIIGWRSQQGTSITYFNVLKISRVERKCERTGCIRQVGNRLAPGVPATFQVKKNPGQ